MDLEKLKKKRATIRSGVTRLVNTVDEKIAGNEVDAVEIALGQLTLRKDALQELDEKVFMLIEQDKVDEEVETCMQYMDNIATSSIKGQRFVKRNAVGSQFGQSVQRGSGTNYTKLPKLDVRKFEGQVLNWQEFYDQFMSAVHNNSNLTSVDKFNYLRSLLTGSALTAIKGLPLTDANYDSALKILKERFGRKDTLINAHFNKLLNLPSCKKGPIDVTALRKLHDECQTHIRSLEAIGIEVSSYGSLLTSVVLKTLPAEIMLEWSRKQSGNISQAGIDNLMTFLRQEIEAREEILDFQTHPTETQKAPRLSQGRSFGDDGSPKMPTATALTTGTQAEDKPVSKGSFCLFCNDKTHRTDSCGKITEVAERRDIIRKLKRCFLCLGARHFASQCRSSKKHCGCCGGKHNALLCLGLDKTVDQQKKSEDVLKVGGSNPVTTKAPIPAASGLLSVVSGQQRMVLLQTVAALTQGSEEGMKIRCLIDGGSQRSFIRSSVSRRLGLINDGSERVKINVFGEDEKGVISYKRVKLKLENVISHDSVPIEVLESDRICLYSQVVPSQDVASHLQSTGIELSDMPAEANEESRKIDVLIGADMYWRVVTGRIYRLTGSLVAVHSHLGWMLHGTYESAVATSFPEVLHIGVSQEDEDAILRRFWEVDSMGIRDSEAPDGNTKALQQFSETIREAGGRYEVRLPWRENRLELESNWNIAHDRFWKLMKRLKIDAGIFQRYETAIREYMKNGHAELVTSEMFKHKPVFFLPHHAIIKEERKTTKVRIVFDASSHAPGSLSLNNCLWAGPSINQDILKILLRFRSYPIVLISDIEKAFLQISLAEEDRNVTMFIWVPEGTTVDEVVSPCVYRMTRVLFGASSSPFLLAATLRHHLKKWEWLNPTLTQMMSDNYFVDDLILGAGSVDEAYTVKNQAQEIMAEAKMHLRKWSTNSRELRQLWKEADDSPKAKDGEDTHFEVLKVLGVPWDIEADEFTFVPNTVMQFAEQNVPTKRTVLKTAARIFDPFGFINPFGIIAKCLLQKIWKRKLDWDERLPPDLEKQWTKWKLELPRMAEFRMPRRYALLQEEEISLDGLQLHAFSDASADAYGCVIYLRPKLNAESAYCSFVVSKCRVAPLKQLTLPRLELLGALIAARLLQYVKDSLGWHQVKSYQWVDSTIVLSWVAREHDSLGIFVRNRVTELKELSRTTSWRFCPGQENVADKLTRGMSLKRLLADTCWWQGPVWLSESEEHWPMYEVQENAESEDASQGATSQVSTLSIQTPLDLQAFSSLYRLVRVMAWILRFISNIKGQKQKGCLSSKEILDAKTFCVRLVQEEAFIEEITQLRNKKELPTKSKLKPLAPFLDDKGVLRLGGRLQFSELSPEERNPVILPARHPFSDLWILECHRRLLHAGVRDTLLELREHVWLIRARQAVKRVLYACFVCRRSHAKASKQIEAPLPKDRVTISTPFHSVGIDYAGPLFVKLEKNRNTPDKVFILLFTCLTTRAVHLELVSSLTTAHFLLALRRFISRRGLCAIIYSDNALTFKRAEKDLKQLWKLISGEEAQAFYGEHSIEWKYIVEKAAWWGGAWERMVQTVKRSLRKVLGRMCVTFEELLTVLTEVEAMINSRPLTFLGDDPEEELPLTPGHFLVGRRVCALPRPREEIVVDSANQNFRKKWNYRQRLLDHFWQRWRREYLMFLKSAHEVKQPSGVAEFKVGDLVLVNEEKLPRHLWKMGRVQQLVMGRDGKIRSCVIGMPHGKLLRRAVQHLIHLEV